MVPTVAGSDVVVRWDHSRYPAINSRGGKYKKIDALLQATGHLPSYVIDHEVGGWGGS